MIEFSGIALANDKFGGFVGLYFFQLAELGAGEVFPLAGFGFFLQWEVPLIAFSVETVGEFLLEVGLVGTGAGGFNVLNGFAEH